MVRRIVRGGKNHDRVGLPLLMSKISDRCRDLARVQHVGTRVEQPFSESLAKEGRARTEIARHQDASAGWKASADTCTDPPHEVWGNLLILVRHPLVGTGFESFWLGPRLERLWSIYWWHPNEAHNGYLEIYLNLGWIGLTLLGLVIVTGYQKVLRTWRRNPSMGSIWLSFFFVGLVYNFTEAAFFKMLAPAWIFYLFATVGAPAVQGQPSEENVYPLVGTQARAALHQEVV